MSLRIGYDDNLGFPRDFTKAVPCELIAYHQLSKMITAFDKEKLWGIFTPAGTLPYLKQGVILAQACLQPAIQADFVTPKNLSILDLNTQVLGRINPYCTTSFWGLLIALMPHFPKGTILEFKETNGFYDLLEQTTLGNVDGAMVWNRILKKFPDKADKVHVLFTQKNLPPPILYVQSHESQLIEKITRFTTQDKQFLFSGFKKPDDLLLGPFIDNMKNVTSHFIIQKSH
ncbi:hypothetical protein Lgra_0487 [Legionella gratiana]|uniref:Uncharacterized protein n=1 Tax=Legionella gratiana TaxID=45066 RepID=A0A378JAM1_9GAMM|nr:hypothetical protein [Legionella gratiana]KTD14784.1 hypothetical protein Lgra_0487 [Legionella gratiana]STX44188.1 Uncharacterised protein [Legionella gratiana]